MRQFLNWPKIVLGIVYAAIFATGFFISYEGLTLSRIFVKNPLRNIIPTPNAFSAATPRPLEQVEPDKQEKGTYNVLFLGYGGAGHEGSLLTDSMIVAHVNVDSKKVTFVSVPRDLWVNGNHKINASALSGFADAGPVVTSLTELPVNYFVAVDFGGFAKIIDELGGITADTPAEFDDPYYPIIGQENNTCGKTETEIQELKTKYSGYNLEIQFTCRYEDLHYNKGPAQLTGSQALKYVRSRHGDSDFGRSARQIAVLKGIANKLISFQAMGKFDQIAGDISGMVRTNLDAGTIKSLIQILGDTKAYTYNYAPLTTDNVLMNSTSPDGQFILVPRAGNFNFSEVKDYINKNF